MYATNISESAIREARSVFDAGRARPYRTPRGSGFRKFDGIDPKQLPRKTRKTRKWSEMLFGAGLGGGPRPQQRSAHCAGCGGNISGQVTIFCTNCLIAAHGAPARMKSGYADNSITSDEERIAVTEIAGEMFEYDNGSGAGDPLHGDNPFGSHGPQVRPGKGRLRVSAPFDVRPDAQFAHIRHMAKTAHGRGRLSAFQLERLAMRAQQIEVSE